MGSREEAERQKRRRAINDEREKMDGLKRRQEHVGMFKLQESERSVTKRGEETDIMREKEEKHALK